MMGSIITAIQLPSSHKLIILIGATRTARLSARQIIALFQGGDLHDIFMGDDGEGFSWNRPRRRSPPDPNRFPEVPSTKGAELMHSGSFGTTSSRLRLSSSKRLARLLLEREISLGDYSLRHANEGLMAQVCNILSGTSSP